VVRGGPSYDNNCALTDTDAPHSLQINIPYNVESVSVSQNLKIVLPGGQNQSFDPILEGQDQVYHGSSNRSSENLRADHTDSPIVHVSAIGGTQPTPQQSCSLPSVEDPVCSPISLS
jgi:hypothetical protein